MGSVMKQWSGEIAAATDEAARRALLGRISVWRATKLGDMVAQRQAAGAISRLHALLGNSAGAEQEARSLISLCQTHPAAPKEDLREAQALLAGLGGEKAIVGPRPSSNRRERKPRDARERRERGAKPTREDRTNRVGQAMSLARKGKWEDANQALAGGRGPSTQLARTWIRLAWALSAPDDAARVAGIREVESSLAEYLERGGRGRSDEKAEASKTKEPRAAKEPKAAKVAKAPIEHPLDDVLGTLTPKRWRDRLRLLEEAVLASPERVDEIAAMALDHHVAVSGDRSPAPWLANLVSTALAAGGTAVKSAVDSLTEKGAFAVSLYAESAFDELVALRTASEAAGYSVVSLRRGVLSRGEPADRRVWTFRAEKDGTELLYARAPESDVPWEKDLAVRIANRLPELCPRIALYAPGSGNDALRAAAEKLGLHIVTDPSTDALVASFGTLAVSTAPPSPAEALKTLMASGVPEEAALDEAVGAFGRAYQAFRACRPVLDERTDSDAASARLAFLKSIDRVAPEHVRIPEGTSWAVRLSAAGVDTGLLSDTSRFGGPGIDMVVGIATGLAADNLTVDRVQVGASKRERREDAVLAPMDAPYGGLWRLMVGDVEVAVLTDLSPEGRVAATRLLTGDGPRVVVVSLDGDLLSWWRSTGGADPIGWTGAEGADVARAIGELTPAS